MTASDEDYRGFGFFNRILYDLWVCACERGDLDDDQQEALRSMFVGDEQWWFDKIVGPSVDAVEALGRAL